MRTHYPRTPHLPWSPGASGDDVRTGDLSGLRGLEVVVTEKLDGENTTLYQDGLHARSLDSAHHPSRTWVKALQGRIGPSIPAGWRICGENLYARHSIPYRELVDIHPRFAVRDQQHPARPGSRRDPLQLLGQGGVVRLTSPLGVGELPEHHLRNLQPRDLRVELGEFLPQPLGTVGQHQPPLHHPRHHVHNLGAPPVRPSRGEYEATAAWRPDSAEPAARQTISC